MSRVTIIAVAAAILLTGCDRKGYYRQAGNPQGQNPNGTPSDRTGGARNAADDGAGGGSGKNPHPADQKNQHPADQKK
jgi:hypothetical protein